jgi:hypothetical protein
MLKKYTSPGSDQILAELIQTGDETLLSDICIYKYTLQVFTVNETQSEYTA